MSHSLNLLAIDLGAESGRAMLGQFNGEQLSLSEVHRFPNGPVRLPDGLHWDALRLWTEVKRGLALAAREQRADLAGVGLDTWGVDFGLLDRDGALIANPYHYRDSRTDGMLEAAFRLAPREEIFERTGIQFMQINTLYQLLSMVIRRSPALDIAETFLTMPDLLNTWLTGHVACEFSNATTTQCYDPREGNWAMSLLDRMGIPTRIFPEVVPPGTILGSLGEAVAEEVGLGPVPVVAPATHDTGSAVASVPFESTPDRGCYISSGTWSLMGTELTEPVITDQSLAYNFTNEGGVCGTFRLLKNIMGLWLVQECRRLWAREGHSYSYDELTRMAGEAIAFVALVDPDDPAFLHPADMPAEIRAYCARTGQPVPEKEGGLIRCVLESLALTYRSTLERLEAMLGHELEVIHIVGGGSQNRLLCQFAADATQRPVIAGPVEATAIGNLLMQALALGEFASLSEARTVVRESFGVARYQPGDSSPWDAAYGRFTELTASQH